MTLPSGSSAAQAADRHPRGLRALFVTEMWERFSYYGMRALLVLFMTDAIRDGGMGLADRTATAIYGLYTAGVYLAALPGGWLGDRFLGAQRCVWHGGIVIAAGHFLLAVPSPKTFYPGLLLVVLGTGLLKPNISAMVGELYPEGGVRRDAGFTIFYMGINLGAAIGPLVTSALGEKVNWHYGFGAAGVGMLLGLVQFQFSRRLLGEAGLRPGHTGGASRRDRWLLAVLVGGIVSLVSLCLSGMLRPDPVAIARATVWLILGIALLYFLCAFLWFNLDFAEKQRVAVIAILFAASAMFWAGLEQAGSSLNLFAERQTQRVVAAAQWEIPAGWFQSLSPVFVISLAPVMAALWVWLGRRRLNPSLPAKFAAGLILLGAGFLAMALASRSAGSGHKVWPTWLVGTYLLHTVGELCLSPVGLSSVTKLAPRRLVGQMMGVWFLATSLGNLIAGLLAGNFSDGGEGQMGGRFLQISLVVTGAGIALLLFTRPIKRLMKGIV